MTDMIPLESFRGKTNQKMMSSDVSSVCPTKASISVCGMSIKSPTRGGGVNLCDFDPETVFCRNMNAHREPQLSGVWRLGIRSALAALLIPFILTFAITYRTSKVHADPPPICCQQPGPDQFTDATYGNLDVFNPLSKKVREQGIVVWRYEVVSGCDDGMGPVIGKAMGNIYNETGVRFAYVNDATTKADLVIRANCGVSLYSICGQVTGVNCLGRGFPYDLDIDLNTDILSYYEQSQVAVVLHELMGHALATWDEGYCKQAGTPVGCTGQFASVPNYTDFMNTGPLSRHFIGDSERARWGRTQGAGAPKDEKNFGNFICLYSIPAKALFVALYGSNGSTYRYIGSVRVDALHVNSDGCVGIGTAGYLLADEHPCIDLWNNAVTVPNQLVYRYDRCM